MVFAKLISKQKNIFVRTYRCVHCNQSIRRRSKWTIN